MQLRPLSILALWLACLVAPVFAAAPVVSTGPRSGKWAHEGAKLTPDEHVTWGRLDNGFRYALLPHKGVPGRVALQLIVLSGSLDERPNELGIAHYIEHLAFGGSKNFKAEEMVSLFQRLGVEYGSDVNAHTTFDSTVFKLDFRENDPALLRDGLRLFRDFGDGVSFEPRIIEQERRIVLAELRLRNTLSGQQQEASLPVVFNGLQFAQRSPGGSEALIAKFTREQFLEFYRRNYRSDLMVLVGAGDFDPAAMETTVRELFGDMVRPAEPIPVRNEGKLDARGLRAGIFRIPGSPAATTEVASVAPLPTGPDSREAHVALQRRQFVMDVFSQRLHNDLADGLQGEASYSEILGHGVAMASATVGSKEWSEGFRALDEMVRITMERGLDAGDFEMFRRRELRMATVMVDQLATLDPSMICEGLVDSITSHTVFEGFERRGQWMRESLEKFTPAEAQQVFRTMWAPPTMAFHVSGGVDLELTSTKILQDVQKQRRNNLSAVSARQHRDTPFTVPKVGTPTEVVERKPLPILGAELMRFGNNVRLNFAPTKQEPGLVRAIVRVGTGLLEMPGNKPALKEFGLNTLIASGSVHFRPEPLSAIIGERLLDFDFDVTDRDAFTFRSTMMTENLEVFLGIVADFLYSPQFNSYVHQDEKLRAAMGRIMSTMGMGEGLRELSDHLFKGDARFTMGQPLDYLSMSVLDVRRWMEPSLAKGYVEVTIVGDISDDTMLATMKRTLGAIPARAATKTTATPPKPVKMVAPAGYKRFEFVGEQNTGLAVANWPITETMHVRDQAALELLAKILEIRVRTEVRERLGLAYSPQAEFVAYDGFPAFAVFSAQIDCAPADAGKVAALVETIGATLASGGMTEGEFIGARGILKSQIKRAFRENSFLSSVLMRAQERPEEIEEIVGLHEGIMDTITRDEVNAWAARILPKTNCRSAAVVPKAFVGFPGAAP